MYEALGQCPICDHKLKVTKLSCTHCKSTIEGEFSLGKFSKLSNEQKYFAEIFIKNRGNIKEIEKELGISYPTVRRNLDQVIEALGYHPEAEDKIDKKDILEQLSKGEITSEQALKLMKG